MARSRRRWFDGRCDPRLPDMVLFTISNIRAAVAGSREPFDTNNAGPFWWSQTGSNRRPHACKARALPTELWPHWRSGRRGDVVGLGRLERPTSPLSGVRSNHLSYRPDPRIKSEDTR